MTEPRLVAALFVRADSCYKKMPGVDCWDIERDARRWPGGCPVVAHPPCRAWGKLAHLSNPRPDEKALAVWSVEQIRRWGGVLEHPAASRLWQACDLPSPAQGMDEFGGWTFSAPQHWWGHRADKATRFYIAGCAQRDLPPVNLVLGEAPCLLTHNARTAKLRKEGVLIRPECKRPEREHTPPALAEWLVELARRTTVNWEALAA